MTAGITFFTGSLKESKIVKSKVQKTHSGAQASDVLRFETHVETSCQRQSLRKTLRKKRKVYKMIPSLSCLVTLKKHSTKSFEK